ncbi:MAG: complex I NDUFA9 subunit family protein [Rhodopila sp.]
MTLITVFGGTGFLGRRIVERLIQEGATPRIAVRNPDRAAALAGSLGAGRVTLVAADVRDPSTVAAAVRGSQGVVNAVSAYVEKGEVTYTTVHVQGAGNIAGACRQHGISRLVHISGIGADAASRSAYIRARGLGERAVREALPSATILRPSVMFAAEGGLLSSLERIARSAPVIPLIGTGTTRMQPVHADDVAEAVCVALRDAGSAGKTYELAGLDIYSMREIFEMVLAHIGRPHHFVQVPFWLASPLARLLEYLPGAPLTVAQVDLLRGDNVTGPGAAGLADLGITPRKLSDTIRMALK